MRGLTPRDQQTWETLDRAAQSKTRRVKDGGGQSLLAVEMSIPELASHCECSERTMFRSLSRLKNKGRVYTLGEKGNTSVFYLSIRYAGDPPTPDISATPTPDTNVSSRPVLINNARARHAYTTTKTNTKASSEGEKPNLNPQAENTGQQEEKAKLIAKLEQLGVNTKPHRRLIAWATCDQLSEVIGRGERRAHRAGYYIAALRGKLGISSDEDRETATNGKSGFERAGEIWENRTKRHSKPHTEPCTEPIQNGTTLDACTSYQNRAGSVETTEYRQDPAKTDFHEVAANSELNEAHMQIPNGGDIKTAQKLIHAAANRTAIKCGHLPDAKITAQIVMAAGGLDNLVRELDEVRKNRNLRQIDRYGWYLDRIRQRRLEASMVAPSVAPER